MQLPPNGVVSFLLAVGGWHACLLLHHLGMRANELMFMRLVVVRLLVWLCCVHVAGLFVTLPCGFIYEVGHMPSL